MRLKFYQFYLLFLWWLLHSENTILKHGQSCKEILQKRKGLQSSRNLRKVVAIYKTDKLILSKKPLSLKARASEKVPYLKVVAPNLFSLTNQLHIFVSSVTLSNNKYSWKMSHIIAVRSCCRSQFSLFILGVWRTSRPYLL